MSSTGVNDRETNNFRHSQASRSCSWFRPGLVGKQMTRMAREITRTGYGRFYEKT